MQCAAHPDVETYLTCSRCGTAICPRCLVQTPVGARCRDCAQLRRPPMYQMSPLMLARAIPAALVVGIILGVVWGLLLPPQVMARFGFFGWFIAVVAGSPIGYFFANVLDRATNHKRGPTMQGIAVAGLILAWLVHVVVAGAIQGDIFGLILTAAASAGAISRLR